MAEPPMAPDRGFAFGPTLIAPSAALPCSSRDGPASTQHGEARWARWPQLPCATVHPAWHSVSRGRHLL